MLRLERIKNRAAESITARELEAARAFIRHLQGPASGRGGDESSMGA
jgi:hypothetical protein